MINKGGRASKITPNNHIPQEKGTTKITITMMEVSTINNTTIKTVEKSTVPHHNMITM